MAAGTDIRIGPWPDGINLLDQEDQLRDTQLAQCENFDVDNTGVLLPRRAFRYLSVGTAGHDKYLLGSVTLNSESNPRGIVNSYDGATSNFYAVGSPLVAPVAFTNNKAGLYKAVIPYQSKLWFVPAESGAIGQSTDPVATSAFTAVATMPYGDTAFVLKDRLFVVRKSSSELYFSKATDFTVWSAPDGGVIQVSPGDNNPITAVVVLNNQIVIFKRDSTYILSFSASPTGDGVLRQISADQGALDAITYNNEVYCYNSRSVFKFVNGFFQDIGLQLNLANAQTIDAIALADAPKINVVGKTLIFGSFSNITYAMNLDTGAWSVYVMSSTEQFYALRSTAIFSRSTAGTAILFGGGKPGKTDIFYFLAQRPEYAALDLSEDNELYIPGYVYKTKHYDFDDSETWKRLHSWHMDLVGNVHVDGHAATWINRGSTNLTTRDAKDLIGQSVVGEMKSFRFKTVAFGYRSYTYFTADSLYIPGVIVRGIRAVVGVKAPVST